ncbi:MAG: FkbM family methyltransferase [Gemmatales bacterium]
MFSIFQRLYSSKLRNYTRKLGLNHALAYLLAIPERWREKRDILEYRNKKPDRYSNEYAGQPFSIAVTTEADYLRCQLFRIDRHLIDGLLCFAEDGDVFWDVGANFGLYSICAARKIGKNGQVVSFDPVTWCCERIRRNIELNHLDNVTVLDIALSDRTAEFTIQDSESPVSGTSRLEQNVEMHTSANKVRAMSGREVISASMAPPPTIIKVDVEGHEIKVLEGLKDVMKAYPCKALLVEVHFTLLERMGVPEPAKKIKSLLAEVGLNKQQWLDASHLLASRA